MSLAHFSFPTPIHFGPGARKLVGAHLRDHGFKRPLIVTDRALARQWKKGSVKGGLKNVRSVRSIWPMVAEWVRNAYQAADRCCSSM
jgi:alcohol dehydrogenase class IV